MQCQAIVYKCGCKVAWVNPWLSCIQCQHVEHSLRVWRLWRRLVSWRQGLCPNSNNDDPFFILIRWHLMPKGNIKRHTLKQGMWSKDLLEYLNKDLDALIFLVGQMQFSPSYPSKSSLQQLSYTTCVSLIIPHCQKLRDLLKVMMIIRKSAMSHQAPVVVSQWDKNWFVMYSHSVYYNEYLFAKHIKWQ